MDNFFKIKRQATGTSESVPTGDSGYSTDAERFSVINNSIPWVEKYRPSKIDEVSQQDEVVAMLRSCLKGGDVPHLLFYGPPGTGKTSTALALCKELFGLDYYRDRILELNASDERGIDVVREKVKDFAGSAVNNRRPDGVECPPFKVIILDEADSMTEAAQAALRRTIEKHSRSTRFCLICNYITRIIEPITSRCAKFRFKSLAEQQISDRLGMIAEKECVKVSPQAVQALIDFSEGDMRKAITCLQCVSRLRLGEEVTELDVRNVSGFIDQQVIDQWIKACYSGSYELTNQFVNRLIADGFPASQLLGQLHDSVLYNELITDQQKAKILEKLAVCDKRLMDGSSEYLQLLDISCEIMKRVSQ